jgi:thiol-disulfide isomerase/thioredoxin
MTQIMPQAAPPLVFTDAAGKHLSLADFSGHFLLVNLWATWCGPCIAELPSFQALAPKLKAGGGLILPISIDLNGAAAVRPFYATHGVDSLPILLDPNGENMQILHTDAIPSTIVINAAGQMVAQMEGAANWNTPRMLTFLHTLGGKPKPAATGFIPV